MKTLTIDKIDNLHKSWIPDEFEQMNPTHYISYPTFITGENRCPSKEDKSGFEILGYYIGTGAGVEFLKKENE